MIEIGTTYLIIYLACILGLFYAFLNYFIISRIHVPGRKLDFNESSEGLRLHQDPNDLLVYIGGLIEEGANAFLFKEYSILTWFCAGFALVIKFAVDHWDGFGTTIAFILGAGTSVLAGYLGMKIAVFSNYRTAFKAQTSLAEGFTVAFRAGCVMGFSLVCLSLAVMTTLVAIYRGVYDSSDYRSLYESIAGYGLGGSTIALFGRVGGGIYTKAADVGADLVGKVEKDLPEDSPKNPATIADNVGDNVGDIAGMGADLFGSFAESTCAALVILSSNPITITSNGYIILPLPSNQESWLFLPLLLSAFGVFASFITSFFATNIMRVREFEQIERTLKYQLIISTLILLVFLYLAADACLGLEGNLTIYINCINPDESECYSLTPFRAYICASSGLVAGLLIGLLTEYYTSNAYKPVAEVAEACRTGAATNIIYGLALGYLSTVFPVILLALAAYISHKTLGMLGLALAALGMLSNLAIGLAIDAYGPISDNAGGIAEMAELGEDTRKITDALDAAGNTTAAIGKGFAIGSAALVSLSLYGAFITRASSYPNGDNTAIIVTSSDVTVTDALVFSGLLVGAMLPYGFSAMTMKSVGKAANQMVEEIRRQLREHPGIIEGTERPDYKKCVEISTEASLKEMIGPGTLVIVTPILVGIFFGPRAVAGLLPGALISGVQMAISSSNTGGAWDNAKKYIESGKMKSLLTGESLKKGSDEHKAAVIGDTVGDPLKDTSGPSLNILIKLMAILSLVFVPFFQKTAVLVNVLQENPPTISNN